MIRDTHLRRALLCVAATVPLVTVWALGYSLSAGTNGFPVVPVLVGLGAGVLTVLAGILAAGYPPDPARRKPRDDQPQSPMRRRP
jgi:hypothetical protein